MTPQAHHLAHLAEEMLLDAGYTQDAGLRDALLALGSLASLPAPVPTGDLARLLANPGHRPADGSVDGWRGSETGPVDQLARRRRRAHGPTVLGLALIAGMGMGVGGVAASSPVPGNPGSPSIQHMLEDWAPAWSLPVTQDPGAARADVLQPAAVPVEPASAEGDASEAVDRGKQSPAPFPAVEDPSVRGRGPASTGVPAPAAPSEPTRGNGEAQSGGGQGPAAESGNSDAGPAAGTNGGGAPALPEQAAGRGGAVGRERVSDVAEAVPGVLAEAAPEGLLHGADTAGPAVKVLPGNGWLQKFNR